ncbi:MAG: VWA domain-containing protein, partial [Kiloniellales bacterium]
LAVAAGQAGNYVPEDVPTVLTLTANTGGSPLDPNDGLTEIVVDFGTAIDLNGSDTTTQWQLDPAGLAAILALPEVTGVALADGGSVLTITLNGTTQSFSADITMTTPLDSDVDLDGVIVTVTAVENLYGSTGTGSTTNDIIADAVVDGTEIVVTAAPSGLQDQFAAIDLNTQLVFGEDSTNVGNSSDPSQADVTDGSTADDLTEFVSSIVVQISDKSSGTPTGTLQYDSPLPGGVTVSLDAATNTWTFEIDSSVSRADVEALVESFEVKPAFNYSGTLKVEITTTTEELNTPPGSTLPASGKEINTADNIDIDSYSIDVEVIPITVHKQVEVSGGEPKPFNICFIIDRSGSMNSKVPGSGGQSRFNIAEDAFRALIANIRAQGIDVANVRLLGFSTGTLDVTDFDHLPTDDELDDFFDDLGNPNGGTRYEPPLQSASQFLSSINDANPGVEYDNRIFFLSDGGNNNSAGGFLLGTSNGNNNAGAYDDLAKLYGNVGDVGTDIPNLTIKSVGFGISKAFNGHAQSNFLGNTPVNAYLALDQSDDNMVNGSAIVSNANNGADLAAFFGSVIDPSLVIGTLFEGHILVGDGQINEFAHLGRAYDVGVLLDNADREAAAAGDVVANDGGVVTIKTGNGGFLTVWFVDHGGNSIGDFRYEGPPNYPGERTDTITYVAQDDFGLQPGQLDVIISGQAPANGNFENGNLVDWHSIGSVYVEDNAGLSSGNPDGGNFVAVLATNNASGLDSRAGPGNGNRKDEGVVHNGTLKDGNLTPVEDLGKDSDLRNLALYDQSDLEAFLASNGQGSNAVDLSTLVGDDLLDGAVIQTSFQLDPLFGTPDGNQNLSISFDWNFATDEGVGGQNDIAFVVVEGQLFLLGSVDGSSFGGGALDVGESQINYDRSTGWQSTTLNLGSDFADVDGDNVIHIAFGVMDGGSNVGRNSALLLDNVQADVS